MHQIKIFTGLETQTGDLEKEVNGWLKENNVEVLQIFGNIAPQTVVPDAPRGDSGNRRFGPSDLFLVVVYRAS
jgi:hypothetical protein